MAFKGKNRFFETGAFARSGETISSSGSAMDAKLRELLAKHQRLLTGYTKELAGQLHHKLEDGTEVMTTVNPFGLAPTLSTRTISKRKKPKEVIPNFVYLEHGLLDYAAWSSPIGYTEGTVQATIDESQAYANSIADELLDKAISEDKDTVPWVFNIDAHAPKSESKYYITRDEDTIDYQIQAPPSSWTGIMREFVQALYGTNRTYTTTAGPACYLTIGTGTPMGCWWGNTTGMMHLGNYEWVFLRITSSGIYVRNSIISEAGKAVKDWLIAEQSNPSSTISPERIKLERIAILSQISPDEDGGETQLASWTALAGSPLAYGWQFDDAAADGYMTIRAVCIQSGAQGITSATHTVSVAWSEGVYIVNADSEVQASNAGMIGSAALMRLESTGYLQRAGTTKPATSDSFDVFGFWNAGVWETESFTGNGSSSDTEYDIFTRDICGNDGSYAGESTHAVYHTSTSGQLSSASYPCGVYSIRSAPVTHPGLPGIWTQEGSSTESNGDLTWYSTNFPSDNTCLTKPYPTWPEDCAPCTPQFRKAATNRENISRVSGYLGTGYSSYNTFVPAQGDATAYYIFQQEYKTIGGIRIEHLIRITGFDYDGRCLPVGADPEDYCYADTWHYTRDSFVDALSDGPTEYTGSFGITSTYVFRRGKNSIVDVYHNSGSSSGEYAGIIALRPGVTDSEVDASNVYSSASWDQMAIPQWGLDYNAPISVTSASGIEVFSETLLGSAYWTSPYTTAAPAHWRWSWVGKDLVE